MGGIPEEVIKASIEAAIPELSQPDTGPERPGEDEQGPVATARRTYRAVYWLLKDLGTPGIIARLGASLVTLPVLAGGVLITAVLWALVNVGSEIAKAVIQIIDRTRKQVDPVTAQLAVEILNELTGAELTPDDLPTGKSLQDHLERARAIGTRLHEFLESEFAPEGELGPDQGRAAARRFSGFVVNFGVSTAMLSLLGELETFGFIDQFRELGVEVARNLGLGRLHRQALLPLIRTTITNPLQEALNRKYLPTRLKPDQVIKAFIRGALTQEEMLNELAGDGINRDRAEALIEETRTRLNVQELELAVRYGVLSRDDAIAHLLQKGFTREDAALALELEDLKRVDTRIREYVATLEKQFLDGVLDADQLRETLAELPITEREQTTIRRTAAAKVELPRKFLSVGELRDALAEGVIDVDELSSELKREGYSPDDQRILRVLALLKLAERKKGVEERAARHEERQAKAVTRGKKPPGTPKG